MTVTIYHNPRCSKSRAALAIVESSGVAHSVVRYLDESLTPEQVLDLAAKVADGDVAAIIRPKEAIWREEGVDPSTLSNTELAKFVAQHPRTLERAIVVRGDDAVVARPPELLNTWL